MRIAELNITQKSEDDLAKISSGPSQLEAVITGGAYLLLQSDHSHWVVPSFTTLCHLIDRKPKKGVFNYTVESITNA
jgi:hypothetical protein